jgi:hypothetical protein
VNLRWCGPLDRGLFRTVGIFPQGKIRVYSWGKSGLFGWFADYARSREARRPVMRSI